MVPFSTHYAKWSSVGMLILQNVQNFVRTCLFPTMYDIDVGGDESAQQNPAWITKLAPLTMDADTSAVQE